MNKYAVIITVLFALVVTIVSLSMVFWEFYKLDKQQYIDNIFTKHSVITQIYREHRQRNIPSNLLGENLLEANLAIYKLRTEKDKSIQKIVIKNATVLKRAGFKTIFPNQTINELRVTMLELHNKIYFLMESSNAYVLIEDEDLKTHNPINSISFYTTMIAVIILSYFLILARLRPLTLLRRKIAKFGDGNLNISFKTSGSDEIALVSNELESTRIKINTIMESRTLFLRNIMHELKTPIAKGTIATQMLDSQKQRDRFVSIFGRLETLVNEFALIEEVTSIADKQEFKEYRLVDIIDGAIDMAMIEDGRVGIDVNASVKVTANFRLYATAIKNMIDNGLKYSTDGYVEIKLIGDELYFDSMGDCIANPIEFYIEPFTKDNPSKNSFGLGLYLVDSILKAHGRVLAHEYKDGENRFIFA